MPSQRQTLNTLIRELPALDARHKKMQDDMVAARAEMDAKFALVEEGWNGMHRV